MVEQQTDIEIIGTSSFPTFAQRVRINGVEVDVVAIRVHGTTNTAERDPVKVTLELIPSSLRFSEPGPDTDG